MPSRYQKRNSEYRHQPHSGKKAPEDTSLAGLNLAQITSLTEDQARTYLEKIRWPEGPVCPHCTSKEVALLQGASTTAGTYKCKAKECRKKFTVRVGTIFESSHIKLRHWVMAFHLMCASKKGVSAHQIHRAIGVTYKTAWFMCHRIRHAMDSGAGMLTGTIEVDETYVGGKPRKGDGKYHPPGRGTDKQPVMVLVSRETGEAVCKVIDFVSTADLTNTVEAHAAKEAVLMTDENPMYGPIGRTMADHKTTVHSRGNYASKDENGEYTIHSNSAESFFALLKRGHYGTFHQMSKKHLFRYCNEFSFRWSHRKTKDGQRTVAAIQGAEGKRLKYR